MTEGLDAWIITIITLIISTAISTIVSTTVKRAVDKKMDKNLAEQKELLELRSEKDQRELNARMAETIKEELLPLTEKIDVISTLMSLNKEGTVTLLRESMKQTRDHFLDKGYATTSEVASWHELYNTYKKLGGNHFLEYVDTWKEEIEDLPREKPVHHRQHKKHTVEEDKTEDNK